jgi:hypothetical protein
LTLSAVKSTRYTSAITRHVAAALFASAARLYALVHVADLLAARGTGSADIRARRTDVHVRGGAAQHEVGRGPANLCAAEHESEMNGFGVLAACFQAVVHRFAFACFIALQTFAYAVLHIRAELVHDRFPPTLPSNRGALSARCAFARTTLELIRAALLLTLHVQLHLDPAWLPRIERLVGFDRIGERLELGQDS